jgi:hypothetical protein
MLVAMLFSVSYVYADDWSVTINGVKHERSKPFNLDSLSSPTRADSIAFFKSDSGFVVDSVNRTLELYTAFGSKVGAFADRLDIKLAGATNDVINKIVVYGTVGDSVRISSDFPLTISGAAGNALKAGTGIAAKAAISAAGLTIAGGLELTAYGDTAISARAGALSITTTGSVKAQRASGVTKKNYGLVGKTVTIPLGITAEASSIYTTDGDITLAGNVSNVDSIRILGTTGGNVNISGTVRLTDTSGIIVSNGDILYSNTSSVSQRIRTIKAENGDVTISSPLSGVDSIVAVGTGKKATISAAVNKVKGIRATELVTSAALTVDSIKNTGAITFGGITSAGRINSTGDIKINAQTTARHGIVTTGDLTATAAVISLGNTDSVPPQLDSIGIRANKITVTGTGVVRALGKVAGIRATGDISIAGSVLHSDTVESLTGKIEITSTRIDTVNAIRALTAKDVSIKSPLLKDSGAIISSAGGNILIEASTGTVRAQSITTTGNVNINSAVALRDSVHGNVVTLAGNVSAIRAAGTTRPSGKLATVKARTITASSGTFTRINFWIPEGSGALSLDGTTLIGTDSVIHSGSGSVTVSAAIAGNDSVTQIRSTGGNITLSTSGKVAKIYSGSKLIISEGANITNTTDLAVADELSILGTFSPYSKTDIKGTVTLPSSGTLSFSTTPKAGQLKAATITLEGKVNNIVDSILTTNGDLTIKTAIAVDSVIKSSGNILVDGSAARVTLKGAHDVPPIAANTLSISNSGSVVTNSKDTIGDIAKNTKLEVTTYGSLTRLDGAEIREWSTDEDAPAGIPVIQAIDGSATLHLLGYPRVKSAEAVFAADELTLTIAADSVLSHRDVMVWLNYLNDTYAYNFVPQESDTVAGINDVLVLKVPASALEKDGNGNGRIAITTDRGISYILTANPKPSANTNRDGDDIGNPAEEDWADDNNWPTEVDDRFSTAVYSNETITVTFVFAKTASKNETIVFGPKAPTGGTPDIIDYLTASTDILPAGSNKVTVIFSFKNEVNKGLRRAILTRAGVGGEYGTPITASIKDDADNLFGKASSMPVTLFDAVTVSTTSAAPTIGYEGTFDLGIEGGTGYEQVRVKDANGDVVIAWTPAYSFTESLTPARLAKIFEAGATLEVKAPNTGNVITIANISGPNTISGGGGGNSSPDANHRIRLEYAPELQTPTGVYPSTNQSFTFKVSRPEGELNDLVVTVVGVSETGDYFTSSAIATPVENVEHDGWSVLVTNITTDIRITISFRASTGINSIVSTSVWSSGNSITISSASRGIAKVYSLIGTLVSEFTYNEGSTSIALPVGTYVVILSDGTRTKLVIR